MDNYRSIVIKNRGALLGWVIFQEMSYHYAMEVGTQEKTRGFDILFDIKKNYIPRDQWIDVIQFLSYLWLPV